MEKLRVAGFFIFGFALAGFGIIQLATQNFLTALFPFSKLPLHLIWVYLTSLLFLVVGILFMLRKLPEYAAFATTILFFLFFLYPHLPKLSGDIHNPGEWTVAFECLAICSGASIIGFTQLINKPSYEAWISVAARYVFAVCLVVFGIQHFMYADFLQTLMPAWMPLKAFWSLVIRFGFLLAAVSLILDYQVRLSMFLLGLMFLVWVLVLHLPRSIQKLTVADEWASLCIALALAGIAFCIAALTDETKNTTEKRTDFYITA